MKKILHVAACVSFSLSCQSMGTASYPEINTKPNTVMNVSDSFLKISDNEYVQYHHKPMTDRSRATIGCITSTRVKTYGGVYPDFMWNIQVISYTESNTILFKDYNNNCLIDIYESLGSPNKCRIIGTNGRNIHLGSSCFSIYDVSLKERSFVGNENKLIFVDNSGTYIVSALQNPIDKVINEYEKNKIFDFKGSVIRISAIYGNRSIDGRPITAKDFLDDDSPAMASSSENSNTKLKETFLLNCSFRTPISIGSIFAPLTKLYPAMMQIEQITGVKLTTPPPSKKSIIKRISDILELGIMTDILAVKDGKVYFVDIAPAAMQGEIPNIIWDTGDVALFYTLFYGYVYPLQNFIPTTYQGIPWEDYTQTCLKINWLIGNGALKGYVFDTSEKAQANRKRIAALPWDNI